MHAILASEFSVINICRIEKKNMKCNLGGTECFAWSRRETLTFFGVGVARPFLGKCVASILQRLHLRSGMALNTVLISWNSTGTWSRKRNRIFLC